VYEFATGGSKQTWVGTRRILKKFKLGVDAWVRGKNIFVYSIPLSGMGECIYMEKKGIEMDFEFFPSN